MGEHLINNEFQSDKYPACPRGKVPLSVKDKAAQPHLWEYAQEHRSIDPVFSDDLEAALLFAGYDPAARPTAEDETSKLRSQRDEARAWVRRITAEQRILTCAFCGAAYPPGTPESNHASLLDHVKVCEKHPMREVEAEAKRLRSILEKALEHVHDPDMKKALVHRMDWVKDPPDAGS